MADETLNLTKRSTGHAPPPKTPEAKPEPAAAPVNSDLERARKRAAELREIGAYADDTTDKFWIDPTVIPEGWTYEWKTYSVLGKVDPAYQVSLGRGGWEPVPLERHPSFMPGGWQGNAIERDGMILMMRPAEITEDVRRRDQRNAKKQMNEKEEQLAGAPPGTFSRNNKGEKIASVKKSYEYVTEGYADVASIPK